MNEERLTKAAACAPTGSQVGAISTQQGAILGNTVRLS